MLQQPDQGQGKVAGAEASPAPGDASSVRFHVTADFPGKRELEQSLQRLGAGLEADFGRLAARIDSEPALRAVILYPNPVLTLARRLEAGDDPIQASANLADDIEAMLGLFRRARRRIGLVDTNAALRRLEAFGNLLEQRFGLNLPIRELAISEEEDRPAGLLEALAAEALRQHPASAVSLTELEASSLPLGSGLDIDLGQALAQWRDPGEEGVVERLREEQELISLQLRQVQEELETTFTENRRLRKDVESVREQAQNLDEMKRQLGRLRKVRRSLEEELNDERDAWRAERNELVEKLKWTTEDLSNVRRSLSWRLTAPFRRVLGLFIGDTKL